MPPLFDILNPITGENVEKETDAHHVDDTVGDTENVCDVIVMHNHTSVFLHMWIVGGCYETRLVCTE